MINSVGSLTSTTKIKILQQPSSLAWVEQAIAQEELEHFEQVNQWLKKRKIPLAPLNSPPYFSKLKSQIRHAEPVSFG